MVQLKEATFYLRLKQKLTAKVKQNFTMLGWGVNPTHKRYQHVVKLNH